MPFAVVGLSGVFIRRANRSGAVAAVIVGVLMSALLLADSHAEGGLVGVLQHPYLNSFLHRTFLCAVITFAALMATSLMTAAPSDEVLGGTFSFAWVKGDGESERDLKLAGFWMVTVFLMVSVLWWVFR